MIFLSFDCMSREEFHPNKEYITVTEKLPDHVAGNQEPLYTVSAKKKLGKLPGKAHILEVLRVRTCDVNQKLLDLHYHPERRTHEGLVAYMRKSWKAKPNIKRKHVYVTRFLYRIINEAKKPVRSSYENLD